RSPDRPARGSHQARAGSVVMAAKKTIELEEGDSAPDFTLPTDGDGKLSLKKLRGAPVVLYFYPKDDTSGCTAEACGFRDSVASHDKFKKKHGLNFTLASDAEGEVTEAYGVWVEKSLYGRKYMGIERATFLIDPKGKIARIWHKVKVPGHVEAVLAAAKELK